MCFTTVAGDVVKYLLTFLLLFSSTVNAENRPWTDTEKQLFVAHTALVIADWSQTRYIAKHPQEYRETNPLFGTHPSLDKVDLLFAATIIGSYYVIDSLDSKREKYLITATIVRSLVVGHNLNLGLRIGF